MIIEFNGKDTSVFDEMLAILKHHPNFEYIQMNDESILSVSGLEIYPSRRKIYRGRQEISLIAKEYDLFCFLVMNKGQVLLKRKRHYHI